MHKKKSAHFKKINARQKANLVTLWLCYHPP